MYASRFKLTRLKNKPFHQRELIFTVPEIAKTLNVSEMTIYRYRELLPSLPAWKGAFRTWALKYGIPRRRGPLPGEMRRQVVRLRQEGTTFRQIGEVLGISHQAAHGHWKRHLERD